MVMKLLLQCENISKAYGDKVVLNEFSLNLEEGRILGFFGKNGAGKTTLFEIIAGLLDYEKGIIKVDGVPVGDKTKAIVAYLPDSNFLYSWMKVRDAVKFFKEFFPDFDENKAIKIIEDMELNMNQKVSSLSKGMKERLNIALTFSRKARLYVLDEPLAAVDPITREKIIDTIIKNFREDSSIIISTHLISDVERLFDEVAFLYKGKIIRHVDIEELKEEYGQSLENIFKEILS